MGTQTTYIDLKNRAWSGQHYFKNDVQCQQTLIVGSFTTAQRLAISSPYVGTIVYDTDLNMFMGYGANGWQYMSTGCEPSDA